jgi:hypothetical protein
MIYGFQDSRLRSKEGMSSAVVARWAELYDSAKECLFVGIEAHWEQRMDCHK